VNAIDDNIPTSGEAEAEVRPGSPEATLPRICATGRRGKEEEEEPTAGSSRWGNEEEVEAVVHHQEAASPSSYNGPCSSPKVEAAALDRLHRGT
jgi:hypothetical protein